MLARSIATGIATRKMSAACPDRRRGRDVERGHVPLRQAAGHREDDKGGDRGHQARQHLLVGHHAPHRRGDADGERRQAELAKPGHDVGPHAPAVAPRKGAAVGVGDLLGDGQGDDEGANVGRDGKEEDHQPLQRALLLLIKLLDLAANRGKVPLLRGWCGTLVWVGS